MSLCLLRLTVSPYNVCCTTAAAVEKKTLGVAVLGGRYLREMKIEKAGEEKKERKSACVSTQCETQNRDHSSLVFSTFLGFSLG